MSKMRIAILVLAIGAAVLAAVMAKGFIGRKPDTQVVEVNKVPMVDILVAAKDLAMGEKLVESTIVWREWPKTNVTEAMITRDEKPDAIKEYLEARARLPIFDGEPMVDKKLVIPGQSGFMSAILPKGMRAVSVGVSEHSGAGGFILPNDRVDVLLTRKAEDPQSGGRAVTTETVLTNVRVLAINQTYRQETGDDKVTVTEGKTATLELNPRQTEVISMIESSGELSLTLRSIAENGDKGLDNGGPQLADKYTSNGAKQGTDRVILRYGVESVSSSR